MNVQGYHIFQHDVSISGFKNTSKSLHLTRKPAVILLFVRSCLELGNLNYQNFA